MINANKNNEEKAFDIKVTRAKAYNVGTFIFDMNVNGIDIYNCWYKEGTKNGREWSLVSFPSRKYNEKYYPICKFWISEEDKANIAKQIESLLGGVSNG